MQYTLHLVKAFTKNPEEGNPAGVLLDANGLSDVQMIAMSAQLGFSESAFVQRSANADFRVRFFSVRAEVPLCGHATIATFHMLKEVGAIQFDGQKSVAKTQESGAGILPVEVQSNGLVVMTQPAAQFLEPETNREKIAHLLGISPDDLMAEYPLQAVSTGVFKLLVPVKSRTKLFAVKPNLAGIAEYSRAHNIRGFHVFTQDTIEKNSDFHARQFNPLIGINEDPITGVAAGALSAYAVKYGLSTKQKFVVEQGYILNKPGKIYAEISEVVKVGGFAVKYGEQKITI